MTEQELYTLLSSAAEITSITGAEGVHNFYLPEGASLPAVTMENVTANPINTLAGDTGKSRTRYSINVWANDYATAKQLRAAVISTMQSYYRVSDVPLHDEEDNIYRFAIDYSIFG